jgi:ABC-type uncharacterized transport system permease subunit
MPLVRLGLLFLTGGLFFAGFLLGLRHMRRPPEGDARDTLGAAAWTAVVAGTVLALSMLVYRAAAARSFALPLSDHFDAFLLLALLLDGAVVYLRLTRRFRSLAFFLLPMIGGLLVLGGVLAAVSPGQYRWGDVWMLLHVVSVIAGTLCFALGCVGGGVYLLAHRQLKPGGMEGGKRFGGLPPLATIERFNLSMVYAGFPLLTLAMVTGTLRLAQGAGAVSAWHVSPKVVLAVAAWVVYGVVAHVPLAPRLRGLHAAWLTIVGFVLFLGTYAAVTWM